MIGREIPENHQIHHLASDNVVKSHSLYKAGVEKGIYNIDRKGNLRVLAKSKLDKVDGVSNEYPMHSGRHDKWDVFLKRRADFYEKQIKKELKIDDVKDAPPEVLGKIYRRIELELDIKLKNWGEKVN